MSYIYKQTFKLHDLVNIPEENRMVVIAEPEEYVAGIYKRLLVAHGFPVVVCFDQDRVLEIVGAHNPYIVILNASHENVVPLLRDLGRNYPGLPVITIGFDSPPEHIKNIMNHGVVSHINRRLGRPQDVVVIVKNILNN